MINRRRALAAGRACWRGPASPVLFQTQIAPWRQHPPCAELASAPARAAGRLSVAAICVSGPGHRFGQVFCAQRSRIRLHSADARPGYLHGQRPAAPVDDAKTAGLRGQCKIDARTNFAPEGERC